MGGADSLSEEVLMEVFHRLALLDDMFAFGAVSKSWRSVAVAARKIRAPCLLMIAQEEKKDDEGGVIRFYSLADDRIYGLRVPPQTMAASKCFGIGFGWILIVGGRGRGGRIEMVHVLRRCRISLPPPSSLPRGRFCFDIKRPIKKAVASADPSTSPSCIIMVIFADTNLLAFSRPGHQAWVNLCTHLTQFVDVIFYRDKFYAINMGGHIISCSIDDNGNQTVTKLSGTVRVPWWLTYLVESWGELLVVYRIYVKELGTADHFEVLRVEEEQGADNNGGVGCKFKLVRVEDLGDKSLFVGNNASFSVTASPENGCKSNCIYFMHDIADEYDRTSIHSDMDVYNLGDRSYEQIGSLHSPSSS